MSEEPTPEVGTSLLFENQRVRVWELALDPGEATGWHRHDHDYVLVLLAGDRIAGEPHEDTQGFTERIDREVSPGDVFFVQRGGVERAVNTGASPYREIIVELLDSED